MSNFIFETWAEIPIKVYAHKYKAEPMTHHSPGHGPGIGIDDIELPEDVKAYILRKYNDALIDEALENSD